MNQIQAFPTSPVIDEYMLKHVNAVALMPVKGGRRISLLGRRMYNVLIHRSQEDGDHDEYHAMFHEIIKDSAYNSNNTDPIKKALLELLSTTVVWQSPTNGEVEDWEACNLLSGVGLKKNKVTKAIEVRWRFDSKVKYQLLSPDRYARLSMEAITQLSTHAAMALYEICARYVDNPGHRTSRQHWRWWRPVLTGVHCDESEGEYRFFKRDVIKKAIAEINAVTNLEVRGPVEYKERDNKTIADIQFEVYLKGMPAANSVQALKKPLEAVDAADLHLIGRALQSGVKQSDAETLLRKFGPGPMRASLGELENRLKMPIAKIGAVEKPGAWLRSNLNRTSLNQTEEVARGEGITADDVKKHRAAWTEEWLRRRKDDLRNGFIEYPENEKQVCLEDFRKELLSSTLNRQILKRFDINGWNHRMVRDKFTKFLGARVFGQDWDKPSMEDILSIAVEATLKNSQQT